MDIIPETTGNVKYSAFSIPMKPAFLHTAGQQTLPMVHGAQFF